MPPPQMSSLCLPLPFLLLEKEMANPLQYSCLENPMDRGGFAGYTPWGSRTGLSDSLSLSHTHTHTHTHTPLPLPCVSVPLAQGESWGSQPTAETAGQESAGTPHFAAARLEEFTTSGGSLSFPFWELGSPLETGACLPLGITARSGQSHAHSIGSQALGRHVGCFHF